MAHNSRLGNGGATILEPRLWFSLGTRSAMPVTFAGHNP